MTLQIRDLSKRFGNNWVFRDVSFGVEVGEVLAILGRGRSGKSTLLRILGGSEKASPPDTEIGLEGNRITIAKIGENTKKSWFRRTTGHSTKDVARLIDDSLAAADGILGFDDPLSRADRWIRDHSLEKIRAVADQKQLTVLYATSDFETAALVADRVAVLAEGTMQQIGTPEEVYTSPATTAVAELTGRCNVFRARRLTSTKFEVPEFQTIDGEHRLFAERADIAKLGAINRNVSLVIRPEDISMSFGASFPEDNLLKAVVTGVKYLGPMTIVELDANGLELEAAVLRLVGLAVGQECVIGLPPDRVRILRD
jgi:ABC-type Fe3+/spermidine/putrescine transport system ATPase subunit